MKLTRKQVLSRAKAGELESVRRLNCWGLRLSDISVCSQMSNLEVLTLSVNQVRSLEPLRACRRLAELYLRQNRLQSLAELCPLQTLPALRVLWLAENPCCGPDPRRYRLTVLRALPGLHKLDNQPVTEEELAQAREEGEPLLPPSAGNGCPAPAEGAEPDSDLLSCSMEETNTIRQQLGMRPLRRNKPSSPRQIGTWKEGENVLNAILLLLQELDREGLEAVQQTARSMLQVLQEKALQAES